MAVLSLAWWGQRLTSPLFQALGTALALGVLILAIGGGLWWLRYDAVKEERAAWQARLAQEKASHEQVLRQREREAAAVGVKAETDLMHKLNDAELVNAKLQ